MDTRPIGIFDSGSGGLSIWKSMTFLLPYESMIYVGDHAHIPYSTKTPAYIKKRVMNLLRFLQSRKVKMIVIACNTATVTGIDYFRKAFPDIPIVGVVPVIKTGAEKSNMKKFAVLSTERTAKSVYQQHLISSFANDCAVFSVGNTDLVSLIENGKKDSKEVKTLLEKVLIPLTDKKIDVLVLGCTHFPFLRTAIQKIVGPQILVLDSGDAVARQVKHILGHEDIQSSVKKPLYQFFTTGNPQNVSMVASHLLQKAIVFTRVLGF